MGNNFIDKLKKKSNKNLTVKPVYLNSEDYRVALDYLKTQNFIKFNKIKNILNINFLDSEPFGNILINEKKEIVGFLGTIFAKRRHQNNDLPHCYLHTWIVNKKYRLQTFRLLLPIIERKIFVSTFSPIKSLVVEYEKVGFKKKIFYSILILITPSIERKKSNNVLYTNNKDCEKFLSDYDLKIFRDHSNNEVYNLCYVDVEKNEYTYLIAKKNYKKKIIPVVEILFISNEHNYLKNIKQINLHLLKKFKTFFIIKNCVKYESSFFYKNMYYLNVPKDFNLDLLYSELC